jgi:hypothetical protein
VFKIRKVTTASGKTAIQVVRYENQKTFIIKHIGSAANEEEKKKLINLAHNFIISHFQLTPLFPAIFGLEQKQYHLVAVENLNFTKTYHTFAYEFLSYFYDLNGFGKMNNEFLRDLSIIRIIEPTSKLKSIELLGEYFAKRHSAISIYKRLLQITNLGSDIQAQAVDYAKKYLYFNFTIVFYDVTTLYFETDHDDSLRKYGYSKDGKSNQPQILIALVVNTDGYPIAVEIFEGNKFEGHTIIPVILAFKHKYKIENLTVVADAAMLSFDNLTALRKNHINYIVAARLASIPQELIEKISKKLNKKENIFFRKKTGHGILLCGYSKKRASKDKSDREKQIIKAKKQMADPKTKPKKLRFLKEIRKSKYTLNKELIKTDELLDGIKGYYTNLKRIRAKLIIQRYQDLWRIEKAFRMTKSDLLARPIYHFKKQSIKAHVLIVFVSLCVSKSIELLSGLSIQKVKQSIWKILDIEFKDKLTKKTFIKRMDTTKNKMALFLSKLKSKNALKV